MNIITQQDQQSYLLLPQSSRFSIDVLMNEWFEPSYWQKSHRIVGESKGRNTTWFISSDTAISNKTWVLRHYYRGGMVAKVSQDRFFYQGIKRSRCYKELQLLQQMQQLGLPTPVPIAARVVRHGLFYAADLLMEKLAGHDLAGLLTKQALSLNLWQAIGKMIAQFHQHGIDHKDLNAHNIMMDDDQSFFLIDFDRCLIRSQANHWQADNIARLKRSFEKEKRLNETFHYDNPCWQALIESYQQHKN